MSATIWPISFCLSNFYVKHKDYKDKDYKGYKVLVLCVREQLSVTLREGQRLRVFESRVLRNKYGP
jgi:hypothetical protein